MSKILSTPSSPPRGEGSGIIMSSSTSSIPSATFAPPTATSASNAAAAFAAKSSALLAEARLHCDSFLKNLETLLKDIDDERLELEKQRQLFEDERKQTFTSGIIKLDVGGEIFTTSYRTLTKREPESHLAIMFSSPSSLPLDAQGRVFIDRDGQTFGFVLNYLRDGLEVVLPTDLLTAKLLLQEAQYYGLKGLIGVIEPLLPALEAKHQEALAAVAAAEAQGTPIAPAELPAIRDKRIRTGTSMSQMSSPRSPRAPAPLNPPLVPGSVATLPAGDGTPVSEAPVVPSPEAEGASSSGPGGPIHSSSLGAQLKERSELRPVMKAKHNQGVLCIQWSDVTIATVGINSKTIELWDFNTGTLIRSLAGHQGAVYCLCLRGTTLISGGSDGKYKVWDTSTGVCLRSKKAHVTLLCLKFDDDLLVTAGIDAGNSFIKLWNVKDGTYLKAFAGHKEKIWCLELCENKVLSGSHDSTVRVWDRKTGQCLRTLKGHTGPIRSLVATKQEIVSGSEDGDIRVWDMETGEMLNILTGHTKTVVGLHFDHQDKSIISASFDGTIRVWDPASPNGACSASASCNAHGVYCFQLKEHCVMSGGEDGSIVLWQ